MQNIVTAARIAITRRPCAVSTALTTCALPARIAPPPTRALHLSRRVLARPAVFVFEPQSGSAPEDNPAFHVKYFFEGLVGLYRRTKDPSILVKNAAALRDPRSLVYLMNRFSMLQTALPVEVFELLDERLNAAALRELDGHHVCDLAYSLLVQGSPPLTELYERMAARAVELGSLQAADAANLSAALGAAGVPMPEGISIIPDDT